MMFNRFYNMEMMNTSASAPSANADSFCAHTARTFWPDYDSGPARHRHDRDYYCDSGTGSRLGHSESKCALVLRVSDLTV